MNIEELLNQHESESNKHQREIALLMGKLKNNGNPLVSELIEKVITYINAQEKYISDIEMSICQHYHALTTAENTVKAQEKDLFLLSMTKQFIESMPYFRKTASEIRKKVIKEALK